MQGIFVTWTEAYTVYFDSPNELFGDDNFTFIGACIEKDLVFMGRKEADHLPINTKLPLDLIKESNFDCQPRGEVLIVKTDSNGDIIECDLKI